MAFPVGVIMAIFPSVAVCVCVCGFAFPFPVLYLYSYHISVWWYATVILSAMSVAFRFVMLCCVLPKNGCTTMDCRISNPSMSFHMYTLKLSFINYPFICPCMFTHTPTYIHTLMLWLYLLFEWFFRLDGDTLEHGNINNINQNWQTTTNKYNNMYNTTG